MIKITCPLRRDGKCTAMRYLRERCNDQRKEKCDVRKEFERMKEVDDGQRL